MTRSHIMAGLPVASIVGIGLTNGMMSASQNLLIVREFYIN